MTDEEKSDSEKAGAREFQKGIGFTIVMHFIFGVFLSIISLLLDEGDHTMLFPFLLLGITQTLYMIPAFVIAQGKGREQLAKGLLVGAAITFMLNAACAGYLIWGLEY
jgi:threonine/homoserine/homoserine lactone efflux protein